MEMVTLNSDFEKKIVDIFDVFDHAGNKTVDTRDIGTILCALGCVPSKCEIKAITEYLYDPKTPQSVHLSKFLPYISSLISNYKLRPASAEELLKAFETLDDNNSREILMERMRGLLMGKGESFDNDEISEMMNLAVDWKTGAIPYEYYINFIML